MTISRNLSDLANQVNSSGTLEVGGGGTGQTSYTDGQLLIGNTTGNTLTKATLTQGTGVTITNGSGSISIANAGVTSFSAGTTGLTPSTTTTGAVTLTGTLAVGNGGTGQTTYTNGQLLIGNTTGNTLTKATLTAGTGMTITNGNGSITLSSPAMVLLGTITTTANNSNSLAVTLTDYEALFCVFVGVSCNAASTIVYISSDNSQTFSVGTFTTAATAYSGTVWLDLGSGAYSSIIVAPAVTNTSNVTTSTTTLYFRCNSTNTFDAGSIRVYGVL